jgi:twitching motility two-component system response regulator PilH
VAIILLIEDSPTDSHAYSAILRSHGHEVVTAVTGEEGIALALVCKPDVVLMDIVMPGLNGYEATRALRANAATADIPVIMVSTKNQETDRIWGLRQGAHDYLVKPVRREALLRSVESALASA